MCVFMCVCECIYVYVCVSGFVADLQPNGKGECSLNSPMW